MELRLTQAARRHRIGRASAIEVIEAGEPQPVVTARGEDPLYWRGTDSRGRELEIVVVPLDQDMVVGLVIHVMPTALRKGN